MPQEADNVVIKSNIVCNITAYSNGWNTPFCLRLEMFVTISQLLFELHQMVPAMRKMCLRAYADSKGQNGQHICTVWSGPSQSANNIGYYKIFDWSTKAGWYFILGQYDLCLHILLIFEGTVSLDMAQMKVCLQGIWHPGFLHNQWSDVNHIWHLWYLMIVYCLVAMATLNLKKKKRKKKTEFFKWQLLQNTEAVRL